MYALMKRLYPITRSITGNGARETLRIVKEQIPITMHEVRSGTKVFDWTVPKEWNIRDAYVKDSRGKKVIDFKRSNLHVLNYSIPVHKTVSLAELKEHLHTLPEHPDWIPYLTSYYKEQWGFCISHNDFKKLREGKYEAHIDSSLQKGSLTYGQLFIPGKSKKTFLLSCYICHPSTCNDNLSGIALVTQLGRVLMQQKESLQHSYLLLFIPETIGAITWLAKNEKLAKNITNGLVVTCVGDPGKSTYKKSRIGNAEIDKAVEKVLLDSKAPYTVMDFFPSGSDERQFCSPGFNLPVGSLMRTPYWQFDEYHTSADDLKFVRPEFLADSFKKYRDVIFLVENNLTYRNLNPKCEPQLGRRGLYRLLGSQRARDINEFAMFWVLNLSDGAFSLLDIAVRSQLPFSQIKNAADALLSKDLLKVVGRP